MPYPTDREREGMGRDLRRPTRRDGVEPLYGETLPRDCLSVAFDCRADRYEPNKSLPW